MRGWPRSADRACLQPNSLKTGNFTGNPAILAARRPALRAENAVVRRLLSQFPAPTNREFFLANRVSSRAQQGIHRSAGPITKIPGHAIQGFGVAKLERAGLRCTCVQSASEPSERRCTPIGRASEALGDMPAWRCSYSRLQGSKMSASPQPTSTSAGSMSVKCPQADIPVFSPGAAQSCKLAIMT
jgi:hypothetical protein